MNEFLKTLISSQKNMSDFDLDSICAERSKLETSVYEALVNCQSSRLESLLDDYSGIDFIIAEIMEKLEGNLGSIVNFIFEMAYSLALVRLSERLAKQKRNDNKILKARSSYRDIILKLIYENQGPMMHKELAESLGISPSNLSNIIQRIEEEEVSLIQTNSLSKYKYYLLTDKGIDYVENHLNNNILKASCYNVQTSKNISPSLFVSLNEALFENKKEVLETYIDQYICYNKIWNKQKKSLSSSTLDIKVQYLEDMSKFATAQTVQGKLKGPIWEEIRTSLPTPTGGKQYV